MSLPGLRGQGAQQHAQQLWLRSWPTHRDDGTTNRGQNLAAGNIIGAQGVIHNVVQLW